MGLSGTRVILEVEGRGGSEKKVTVCGCYGSVTSVPRAAQINGVRREQGLRVVERREQGLRVVGWRELLHQ